MPTPRLTSTEITIGLNSNQICINITTKTINHINNFPTLTLLLLDRFPHHRGAVSSVQAFVSLVLSALLAGAISPLVSRSALGLAATAAGATVLGFLAWRRYRAIDRGEAAARA
jgi:DHA1 family bicyclomycin/chloramphenicol resistance-like MFS transporter